MQPSSVLDRPVATYPSGDESERAPALPTAGRVGTREPARLLVAVDGSAASTRQLIWALQEAARREASVLAVAVVDSDADEAARAAARTLLDAQLLHAVGQASVHARARTALLDPTVREALTGSTAGDLVVVGPLRKTVLRPATRRPPMRRPLIRHA